MPELDRIYLYHIVNIDRLKSIFTSGLLYSDLAMLTKGIVGGTSIAYEHIRERRRRTLVTSQESLYVGGCVPFYFGRHAPMLYRAKMGKTHGYDYVGGQEPIVYLVFRMQEVLTWAEKNGLRWAFTDRNASDKIADFYSDLSMLPRLRWDVIDAKQWEGFSDVKAAEFLVEDRVSVLDCLRGVVTMTEDCANQVVELLKMTGVDKQVVVRRDWYF